jgi:hypothetical protein
MNGAYGSRAYPGLPVSFFEKPSGHGFLDHAERELLLQPISSCVIRTVSI